ncbi:MAG: aromatic ring-hydroxylating dioxygenase subunit alpha [Burkholderiaceae bacterium]
MQATMNESSLATRRWPAEGFTRIPYWVYTDPELYARELDMFFYGPTWNYVGLSCEVPNPGDYKRHWIGERNVVMVRDKDGSVSVLENRCAHKGSQVVWAERGNAQDLTCPYHQWCFSLKGDLVGLPLKRGVQGKGGMPSDFDNKQHGMNRLQVTERNGIVWASFSPEVPSFEAYTERMLPSIDRLFSGRPLKLLGYQRQMLRCNWKMYMENLKDPYHATLLHTFYITFGLWRADNRSSMSTANQGRHGIMVSENTGKKTSEATEHLTRFDHDLTLEDMSLVTPIREFEDGRIEGGTMHPSVVLQQQANSLAVRHVIPRGTDATELVWTFFGFADDGDEITLRRVKHANLVGPAGLVSIDDSEVLKQCQAAARGYPHRISVIEMGGRDTEPADHMLTENQIRDFYSYYRKAMGL